MKSDEQLLKELKTLAEELGSSPTKEQCDACSYTASGTTYKNRFGSWSKAKELAGIIGFGGRKDVNKIKEQMLVDLYKLSIELGHSPSGAECDDCEYTKSLSLYKHYFGSFNKAKERAGITLSAISRYKSDDEMLADLYCLYLDLGKSPTTEDLSATEGIYYASAYRDRFGSLETAKELAGVPAQYKTVEVLLQELAKLYTQLGRSPSTTDCEKSEITSSPATYLAYFNSWKEVLEAAGLPEQEFHKISDEALLDSISRFHKEFNRAPTAEDCGSTEYLFAYSTYNNRLGTGWANILRMANVPANNHNKSVAELDLLECINTAYPGEIISGYKLINGTEIDIFIPELKLGVEFNGLYWHGEDHKEHRYHLNKTNDAKAQGIRLIHVFENEWMYKKSLVMARITHIMGVAKDRLYARNCVVLEIDKDTSNEFMENNHIQGAAPAAVHLGLYFCGELVAVQTYCKARFSTDCEWELLRYATNDVVVGGASKLFAYFIKTHKPKSIVSYSDIRWNTGEVYNKLGFSLSHISAPNYWYYKGRQLYSRHKFQKHKLKDVLPSFDANLTEVENMRANGYRRIFDCGNMVFKWRA